MWAKIKSLVSETRAEPKLYWQPQLSSDLVLQISPGTSEAAAAYVWVVWGCGGMLISFTLKFSFRCQKSSSPSPASSIASVIAIHPWRLQCGATALLLQSILGQHSNQYFFSWSKGSWTAVGRHQKWPVPPLCQNQIKSNQPLFI